MKNTLITTDWKKTIEDLRIQYFEKHCPEVCRDHGIPKKIFKVDSANALTSTIIEFLKYSGCIAYRQGNEGRVRNGRFIPANNKRGIADISAIIKGQSVQIEIKYKNDRPSTYQLAEQKRVEQAGGIYVFIRSMEAFTLWYIQTFGDPFALPSKDGQNKAIV